MWYDAGIVSDFLSVDVRGCDGVCSSHCVGGVFVCCQGEADCSVRVERGFRWCLGVAVCAELLLVVGRGLVGWELPWWGVVFPLVLVVAAFVFLLVGAVRDRRRLMFWAASIPQTASRFGVPQRVMRALFTEVTWLLSVRHVCTPADRFSQGECFSYHRPLRPVVWGISLLSIVEIGVVHLAVSHEVLRIVLLIVGVYSLLIMLGFYHCLRANPHCRGGDGEILVRNGVRIGCSLKPSDIQGARKIMPGQGGSITVSESGVIRIPVLGAVNVELTLARPCTLFELGRGEVAVSAIQLYCDDPDGFISSVSGARR